MEEGSSSVLYLWDVVVVWAPATGSRGVESGEARPGGRTRSTTSPFLEVYQELTGNLMPSLTQLPVRCPGQFLRSAVLGVRDEDC